MNMFSLFDWLDIVLVFLISFLKFFKSLQNYLHKVSFGKFFRSYSELLSKFGAISFHEYVLSKGTHPVFYGDPVYKLRRVKGEANFISSGSKGPSTRLIVLSIITGSYFRHRRCLTILEPDGTKFALCLTLLVCRRNIKVEDQVRDSFGNIFFKQYFTKFRYTCNVRV